MNKLVKDGYILSLTSSKKGIKISKAEEEAIRNAFKSAPEVSDNQIAKLTENLEWEIIDVEPQNEEEI